MGQEELKFKGWDWTELAQLVECVKPQNDDHTAKLIRVHLLDAAWDNCGEGDATTAAAVRRFLLALEKAPHSNMSAFYKGLREIESDGMMLRLVAHCLEYLWT